MASDQRMPNQGKKAQRRSLRIAKTKSQKGTEQQARYSTKQENQAVTTRKQTLDPKNHLSTERPMKRLQIRNLPQTTSDSLPQAEKQKRPRGDEVSPSCAPPEPLSKRIRTSTALVDKLSRWKTISEARIDYWREYRTWPTEEQEKTIDRFRDLVGHALAKKSSGSLGRKRSNASLNTETAPTQTSSNLPREQKSVPYRHPLFEDQLKNYSSFMDDYKDGVTVQSSKLCQTLLEAPQPPPAHTFFSDTDLFKKTCKRIRGENETKVIRYISPLIVPSAEILADMGAEHLEMLRETTNACWTNAIPFIKPPPGSHPGPRPQPDFGVGFKKDAFNREQLQKLQPFIGNPLTDSSLVAATYNMYLPFLTSEVKCGASALDIADRQNAHSQSVALLGLTTLFRLVGRENELHREINGFSISHSDEYVRIWGHYAVINGRDITFYRHPITKFDISPTAEGDQRWKAYTFVRNIYDLWLPEHFKKICSAIDMLPAKFPICVNPQIRSWLHHAQDCPSNLMITV
ncbi:uncharacterized protein BDZ99DRAFT_513751 [Mytilinidion resinicola]|uniref:DUF7924 domain-containing protein n=1 Tax=Mytilinidion resinicola TaxID=574789 RepID=A0A6A6Z914_9PEZI|nr:uncharacterized protein BDZ99DRAFT_513751 [Mytilinidion resinicola]KAF2817510.1 hypothetical protein BDZ99DRAFT_513751 [Mytilinidion resinicola]